MSLTATILCISGAMSVDARADGPSSAVELRNVNSWGYQLQRLDVRQAAQMQHDLLVVDYSKDGTDAGALSWSELSQLKYKPDGSRRIVLAYLSIGEAENYRYYWKSHWQKAPPRWLDRENEQWTGNFLIKYWMPAWQRIILDDKTGYLSKIIARGFDGVYLDRIDAYFEWGEAHGDARRDMIEFVAKLSQTAKSRSKDFVVFAQNAEELLVDTRYLAHIDGIAKEDMLFGALHRSKVNPDALQAAHIKHLNIARKHNKPVLVVEYLPRRYKGREGMIRKIKKLNFIPFISERKLDVLFPPVK